MRERLRRLFNWAIVEGCTTETPCKRHGVAVVKLETRAETARTRRLEPDVRDDAGSKVTRPGEEMRLPAHASAHLRPLIFAALSTGCRLGELLSLQWRQILSGPTEEQLHIVSGLLSIRGR